MLATIGSAAVALSSNKDYASLFSSWKTEHGKTYVSASKESAAFKQFALNEDIITAHNTKQSSYLLGHNEFSDMGSEEFFATKLGYNPGLTRRDTFSSNPVHEYRGEDLPTDIDWVAKGAVSPIKNQGQCGSCWAFSTTGSVEGALAIATGNMTVISEEELVQCDPTDSGCQGGLMDNAFKWVEKNGLALESAYPYTSGTGITGLCNKTRENFPVVHVTGYTDVKSGDEAALQSAVAQQPVSIAIEADKSAFQMYKSGVLDNKGCGKTLDHGVLLVGYGTDEVGIFKSKKDYWKVKNSWGSTWGESGYIRMVRNKDQCGLATQPSYPTGAKQSVASKKLA